ncbi:MAG: YicC family protein [Flavobacteriales bacterium]|nr:YicC family protein [Flavobacteriales bacterium]
MINSMTGYGRSEFVINSELYCIEIKTLNSKHIDVNLKTPSIYRQRESEIRQIIAKNLKRGKIDVFIWQQKKQNISNYKINTEMLNLYYKQASDFNKERNKNQTWLTRLLKREKDILPAILNMPDIVQKVEDETSKDNWKEIRQGLIIAIESVKNFREQEGAKLQSDIVGAINNIKKLHKILTPISKKRIDRVKNKLKNNIMQLEGVSIDINRLEQELIYYLEKQDINEEIVRLEAHLDYFLSVIKEDSPNGKKLGFISQELGREINTIGSKASDLEMQKLVVKMKDELEKIKEQLLNVL